MNDSHDDSLILPPRVENELREYEKRESKKKGQIHSNLNKI
jgi:hypothetical protein